MSRSTLREARQKPVPPRDKKRRAIEPPRDELEQSERMDRLLLTLALDGVLTIKQITRHFGLHNKHLDDPFLWIEERLVREAHGKRNPANHKFVMDDRKRLPKLSSNALRHVAGTAEIRLELGVNWNNWQPSAWRQKALLIPDAIWFDLSRGEVAVECDAGAYSREQIVRKTEVFSEYAGQVWGCMTKARADSIRPLITKIDPRAQVIVASPF